MKNRFFRGIAAEVDIKLKNSQVMQKSTFNNEWLTPFMVKYSFNGFHFKIEFDDIVYLLLFHSSYTSFLVCLQLLLII